MSSPFSLDRLKQEAMAGSETGAEEFEFDIPQNTLAGINNNPGNLRYVGQKGATQGQGGFAKFDSPQAGFDALRGQIDLDANRGHTLESFVNKYAPPNENDTSNYLNFLSKKTGKDGKTKLSDIDKTELAKYMVQMETGGQVRSKPKTFDAEGTGYDYTTARSAGIKPNETGHWPSLDPRTGMVLKGTSHPTFNLTLEEEKKLGNKIIKKGDRYYSVSPGEGMGLEAQNKYLEKAGMGKQNFKGFGLGSLKSEAMSGDYGEPGYLEVAGKGVARGYETMAAGLGDTLQWLGRNIEYYHPSHPSGPAITQFGKTTSQYWKEAAQEGFAKADTLLNLGTYLQNPSVKRTLGLISEASASLFAAIATGIATGSPLAAVTLLGLTEGSPMAIEALDAGRSMREANAVGFLATVGTMLLEYLPISHFLGKAKGVGRGIMQGFIEEGLQESAQTAWQNLIAKIGYDDTRTIAEGIVESFIAGAGSGGIAGGTTAKLDLIKKAKEAGVSDNDIKEVTDSLVKQLDDFAAGAAKKKFLEVVGSDLARGKSDSGEPFGIEDLIKLRDHPTVKELGVEDELNKMIIDYSQNLGDVEAQMQEAEDYAESLRKDEGQPEGEGVQRQGGEEVGRDMVLEEVPQAGETYEGPERRVDLDRRQRIEGMSVEEVEEELYKDKLTGLYNRRAFDEDSAKQPEDTSYARLDMDNLHDINEVMTYEGADQLIAEIGRIAQENNIPLYRDKGDEFVTFGTAEELKGNLQKLTDILNNAVVEYTTPDGRTFRKEGIGVSYGTGTTLDEAEKAQGIAKEERAKAGLRAERGAGVTGLVEITAARREAEVSPEVDAEIKDLERIVRKLELADTLEEFDRIDEAVTNLLAENQNKKLTDVFDKIEKYVEILRTKHRPTLGPGTRTGPTAETAKRKPLPTKVVEAEISPEPEKEEEPKKPIEGGLEILGGLEDYGLKVEEEDQLGRKVWWVSGNTYEHRQHLGKDGLGGKWNRRRKAWKFKFDPSEQLLDRLPPIEKKKVDIGSPENIKIIPLSEIFLEELRKGTTGLNKVALQKMVAEQMGITRGKLLTEPGFLHKPIEEAFEYAIVKRAGEIIREGKKNGKSIKQIYNTLKELYLSQPALATRTGTSVENQAYSTPVHLAYLVQEFAGVNEKTTVYEPTAGTGMLLTAALHGEGSGNKIWANELDDDRLKILKDQGFIVTDSNAERAVQKRHSFQGAFNAVVANPPFGRISIETIKGYKISKLEHKIMMDALEAMMDDGKAAFIIGQHNLNDQGNLPTNQAPFLNWLYKHYNVVANIDIPGEEYARQGTSFPVRLIVIDGRKATPKGWAPLTQEGYQSVDSIDEILPILKGVKENETVATKQPQEIRGGEKGSGTTDTTGAQGDEGQLPGPPGPETGETTTPEGSTRGPGGPTIRTGEGETGGSPGNIPTTPPAGPNVPRTPTGEGEPGGGERAPRGPGSRQTGEREKVREGAEGPDTERVPGASDLTDVSADDLMDMFDDFTAPKPEPQPAPQPTPQPGPSERGPRPPRTPRERAPAPREQLDKAKDAAKKIAEGAKKINALLGEEGAISSNEVDPTKWEQIKNIITEMWDAAIDAGMAVKEFVRDVASQLGQKGRGYFQKWVQEELPILQEEAKKKREEEKREKEREEEREEEIKFTETEFQITYTPKSKGVIVDETLIPRKMQQSITNALNKLEESVGDIDSYVADKLGYDSVSQLHKALSADQVDAVALAINNIESGVGMIVGDQTGVGKGRVAAAIFRYAQIQGLKPVFFTEKPNLFTDFYRDIVDIEHDFNPFIMASNMKLATILNKNDEPVFTVLPSEQRTRLMEALRREGIAALTNNDSIVTTYSQIQRPNLQRDALEQVFRNNYVILDESHNASGASATGHYLRDQLENVAGTLYLSATFAKRPDTMPIYYKTSMSRANLSMEQLVDAIDSGGTPLQEIVSNALAELGQYVRREKSFAGIDVKSYVDSKNRARDEALSDEMTQHLRNILDFDKAVGGFISGLKQRVRNNEEDELFGVPIEGPIEVVGGRPVTASVDRTGFAATAHNAIRQLLMAMKSELAVEYAINELKEGRKPVIALSLTMGTFVNSLVADGQLHIGSEFNMTFADVLERHLKRTLNFRIKQPSGETVKVTIPFEALPLELQDHYNEIVAQMRSGKMDLPGSPIDYIKAKLLKAGYTVNELTDRLYVADLSDPDKPTLRSRPPKERAARNEIISGFNNGSIDALIVNAAGATGMSVHSAPNFADQRPRTYLGMQDELNIDIEVQKMGRINRKGQVNLPRYISLYLDIPAEIRPASILSKKLKSLSANTSANSDSPLADKTYPDMINYHGDQVVWEYLQPNLQLQQSLNVFSADESSYHKVSGRMALQPIAIQKEFFETVEDSYNMLIEDLKQAGQYNLEVQELDYQAEVEEKVLLTAGIDESNPFGQSTYRERLKVKSPRKPFKLARIERIVEEKLDGKTSKEYVDEYLSNLRTKANDYIESRREGLQGQLIGTGDDAVDQFERFKQNIENSFATVQNLIGDLKIGKQYELEGMRDLLGVRVYGILTEIRLASGSGNPTAPNRTRLVFAVNNALQRYTVPVSRLANRSLSPVDMPYWWNETDDWDRSLPADIYQEEYVITGNLLQGYADAGSGARIIRFTMKDGTVREGILLPANYRPGADHTRVRVNPDQAVQIALSRQPLSGSVIDLMISVAGGRRHPVRIARARARGGPFYTDNTLKGLTIEGDFETRGQHMRGTFSRENIEAAIRRMYELGETFTVTRAIFDSTIGTAESPESEEGAQYALTEGNAADFVSLEDVKNAFKGQKVGLTEDGAVWINTKGNNLLIIKKVNQIAEDQAALDIGYGERPKGDKRVVVARYLNGEILLHKILADKWALRHERAHWLEDIGLLSPMDVAILKNKVKKLVAAGKMKPANKKDIGGKEDRAIYLANMATKENKGAIKRILDKIQDFVDKIVNLFIRTPRGIAREIETGKIYERYINKRTIPTMVPAYDKLADTWYSHMENIISSKLPGKGTPESYKQMVKSWAKKGIFKQEELEWSGLLEWFDALESNRETRLDKAKFEYESARALLESSRESDDWYEDAKNNLAQREAELQAARKNKITKEEVVNFLKLNRVVIEEVILGDVKEIKDAKMRAREMLNWESELVSKDYEPNLYKHSALVVFDDGNAADFLISPVGAEFEGFFGDYYNLYVDGELEGEFDTVEEAKSYVLESVADSVKDMAAGEQTTKYGKYTEPGGERYREMLLMLPEISPKSKEQIAFEMYGKRWDQLSVAEAERVKVRYESGKFSTVHWDQQNVVAHVRYKDRLLPPDFPPRAYTQKELDDIGNRIAEAVGAKKAEYVGSGGPIVALNKGLITIEESVAYSAHRDFNNEFAQVAKKKILFIEEVQSDWHQHGRKKGYVNASLNNKLEKARKNVTNFQRQASEKIKEKGYEFKNVGGGTDLLLNGRVVKQYDNFSIALNDVYRKLGLLDDFKALEAEVERYLEVINAGAPDAPFKQSWPLLVIKRMIRMAAENGYNAIAWTTGAMQADRYDLSQHIKSVFAFYSKLNDRYDLEIETTEGDSYATNMGDQPLNNLDEKQLEDLLGTELAGKIIRREGRVANADLNRSGGGEWRVYRDLDLQVGGKGMMTFYDNMLPSIVNKFVKKFGGKVEMRESGIVPKGEVAPGKWAIMSGITGLVHQTYETESEAHNALAELKRRGGNYDVSFSEYKVGRTPYRPTPRVHYLEITPAMKREAKRSGFPMYALKDMKEAKDEWAERYLEQVLGKAASSNKVKVEKKRFEESFTKDGLEAGRQIYEKGKKTGRWKKERPDTTILNRIFGTPEHYFEKVPAAHRVYQAAERRSDYYYHGINALSEDEAGGSNITKMAKLKKNDPKSYERIKKIILKADQNKTKITRTDLEKIGLSEEAIQAWEGYREMMNKGLDALLHDMRRLIAQYEKRGMKLPPVATVIDGKKVEVDLKVAMAMMGEMRDYYAPRIRRPGKFMLKATKDGAPPILKFFDYKTTLNHAARKLEKQGYTTEAEKSKGLPEDVFNIAGQTLNLQAIVNKALENLESQGKLSIKDLGLKGAWEGESYTIRGPSNKSQNEVFKALGGRFYSPVKGQQRYWHFPDAPKDMEARIVEALAHGRAGAETDLIFATILATQVANVVRGRGFRARMLKRGAEVGEEVWRGYEEDPLTNSALYIRSVAAGLAKKQMVLEMVQAVSGTDIKPEAFGTYKDYLAAVKERRIDPASQKNVYHDVMTFIDDMRRNEEAGDRIIGTLKGIAVLKYLGFRVSAPIVNLTALATSVPAAMHGYGNIPLHKTLSALGRGATLAGKFFSKTEKLSAEEKALFDTIRDRGWHTAQYNKEALSVLESRIGKGWRNVMEWSMWMFGVTEQFNRVATIAGAYDAIKRTKGWKGNIKDNLDIDALKLAKKVSDRAHGTYGKATLPHVARGKNIAAQAIRMFYVFRKFAHNYLQTMYDLGIKKKNAKAALVMMLAPTILAGASASVAYPVIMMALKHLLDDDPEEMLYNFVEENMGAYAERLTRFGLPGIFEHGISLKGSLEIGILDVPTTIPELLGAPGSLVMDVVEGIKLTARGDFYKGAERMAPLAVTAAMKARREQTEGVTSYSNAPIFWGTERVKADPYDAIARYLSFNPSRIAKIREVQWHERQLEKNFSEMRNDIYSQIKKFYGRPEEERVKEEWLKILGDIKEYNDLIEARGKLGIIPPITAKSIRSNLRRAFTPSKKEKLRAREMK